MAVEWVEDMQAREFIIGLLKVKGATGLKGTPKDLFIFSGIKTETIQI
jgi:hypothetical protein